jgi:CMP-N-acetylneuraminic acid synthetase
MVNMPQAACLAIIPARGGSKRFPRKNIVRLDGRPLIAFTIAAAASAYRLGRTIVSTDDDEIATVARACGADVPFLRPSSLAADQSPAIDVISHALERLDAAGTLFNTVVLLQPTSPFRTGAQIDEAVALFEKTGADTVTSVRVAHEHPYYCWTQKEGEDTLSPFFSLSEQALPRQELPPAFVENGAIYVVKRSVLANGTLYGSRVVPYLMDDRSSLDIDTEEDFHFAESLLNRGAGG